MQVQSIDRMFNFTFEKTAEEITYTAVNKATAIRAKIDERGVRIKKMRDEHGVTDAVLIDIQQQMRANERNMATIYNSSVQSNDGGGETTVSVGAGVINFILTESDFINGEKAQVEHLDLMVRNLRDVTRRTANGTTYVELFKLSYDELKFLGF